MKWLKQFKDILDNNPGTTDIELFRAFPELQGSQERLSAALLYWRFGIIAEEFKRVPLWKRLIKSIWNGFRRNSYRAA